MLAVTPGWPDLEVIVPRDEWISDRPWSPIFIELKTERGFVSEKQSKVIDAIRRAGAVAFVCRSVDEVASALGGFVRLGVTV